MSAYWLHPEAMADIEEIRAHIAEDSSDAANRIVNAIFNRIRMLADFPHLGSYRDDLSSVFRFAVVDQYLIGYSPHTTPLQVLAVFHGRRNPRIVAAILRSRQ